jgi:ComF family protein
MEPPASVLVHQLKYGGWEGLGELMGSRMAEMELPISGVPRVVPVPTSPKRRRARGYDQARVLAEVVARRRGLQVVNALVRPEGGTQVRLGPEDRARNVKEAFRIRESVRSRIRGREVILVDDVLTTGATAISAARVLEAGGGEAVHLVTFARALPFASRTSG